MLQSQMVSLAYTRFFSPILANFIILRGLNDASTSRIGQEAVHTPHWKHLLRSLAPSSASRLLRKRVSASEIHYTVWDHLLLMNDSGLKRLRKKTYAFWASKTSVFFVYSGALMTSEPMIACCMQLSMQR